MIKVIDSNGNELWIDPATILMASYSRVDKRLTLYVGGQSQPVLFVLDDPKSIHGIRIVLDRMTDRPEDKDGFPF